MKTAFVSHESACEALRLLTPRAGKLTRWPPASQTLPATGCVSGQRELRGSRAERDLRALGLGGRPVDLMVPSQAARSSGKAAHFHVWGGVVPAGSMLRLGDELLVSGAELAVVQLCSAQGKLDALLDAHADAVRAETGLLAELGVDARPVVDHPLAWERIRRLVAATTVACEFAGTYRLAAGGRPVAYRAPRLMSTESLGRVAAEVGVGTGTRRARRVCEMMVEGSASPMETSLALMLSLPVDFGGFGFAKPQLNQAVDVSAQRGLLADRDVVTPDLSWGDVALEYDSAEFHARAGGARHETDAVRANILTALGFRVLRVTPEVLRSLPGLTLLSRQLARVLGVELEEPTPLQELRRRKLYMQLMPRASRPAG